MKKIIAAVFLFAVSWNVEAFSPTETTEIICSIPDKYLLRFIDCAYDESPPTYKKYVNNIHECVDQFYETDGRSDSFVIFMCGDVQNNEELGNCVNNKFEIMKEEPAEGEHEAFVATFVNCLSKAK